MLDLGKKFYDMLDKGIIYDLDEDGEVMSWEECTVVEEDFYVSVILDTKDYLNSLDYKPTIYDVAEYLDDMFISADDDTLMFMGLDWDQIGFSISIWEDCCGGLNCDSKYLKNIIDELEYLDVDIDLMGVRFIR